MIGDPKGYYPIEEIDIDDPLLTRLRVRGLLPEKTYRISIWARSRVGRGQLYSIEETTLPDGRKLCFLFVTFSQNQSIITHTK